MLRLRSFASASALFAATLAVACGSSDKHRAVVPADSGADAGVTADSGVGGARGSGDSAVEGSAPRADSGAGDRDSGESSLDSGVPRRDASADGAPSADASGADSGLVLGQFCNFPDPNFESAVRSALYSVNLDGGVPSGPIPVSIASRITSLDLFCDCSQTVDVTGAECLQGLVSVNLSGAYANLDRMRFLPRLTDVSVQYGDGSLYPELAVLPHLHSLDLENDQMSDLSALAALSTLTNLNLDGNQVTDLTPLAGLTNLVSLDLGANQVTDLTPLANLHQLQKLVLRSNTVSDLSPLAGLTSLVDLQLGQNPFTNLGPLSGLVNIQSLDINSSQPLTDFSPLVKNTGLGTGDTVYSNPALSDCTSFKADLQTLTNRGVTLVGFPTCP